MFFYLEWINKRPEKILILDEKPDDLTFNHEFKNSLSKKSVSIISFTKICKKNG